MFSNRAPHKFWLHKHANAATLLASCRLQIHTARTLIAEPPRHWLHSTHVPTCSARDVAIYHTYGVYWPLGDYQQIHTAWREPVIHCNYSAPICSKHKKIMLVFSIHAAKKKKKKEKKIAIFCCPSISNYFQFIARVQSQSPSFNYCQSYLRPLSHHVKFIFISITVHPNEYNYKTDRTLKQTNFLLFVLPFFYFFYYIRENTFSLLLFVIHFFTPHHPLFVSFPHCCAHTITV